MPYTGREARGNIRSWPLRDRSTFLTAKSALRGNTVRGVLFFWGKGNHFDNISFTERGVSECNFRS